MFMSFGSAPVIARAVFLLERGQTDRQTDKQTGTHIHICL